MLQIRVLVEFYHLTHNLVGVAIQECVVLVDLRVVPAFLGDPLLFLGGKLPLELIIVFENGSLVWVVVTVSDIVGAVRDLFGSPDVICDQRESVRPESL